MRVIRTSASLILLTAALMAPSRAEAQCRTIIVGGPRVRVIAPCLVPPPPMVVGVVPAPPPPPPPAAPPILVQPVQPCPTTAPPPPPLPMADRPLIRPQIFTLGMFVEGAMYKNGGMGGGALYAQIRVGRALHLYGSLGANVSCTNCNPNDPTRVDLKTTLGLQYYFLTSRWLAPYLRGSLVYQAVSFNDPNDPEREALAKASQVGGEFAAGLELRLLRWLVLGADVAYVGLKRVHGDAEGPIPAGVGQGVPTVGNFDHGATFRLNVALRF